MRWIGKAGAAGVSCALVFTAHAHATPSSTFWTPMTVDIQGYGVLHPGVDNYFSVQREAEDGAGAFPTDIGLTLGILPFERIRMEVGVDLLEPSDDPLYFNAKIGAPEGALFDGAPALQAGVFNLGTEEDVTNQNVFHAVIGKSISGVGRFAAGPYIGNGDVLVDAEGEEENTGFMVAADRGFGAATDTAGNEYNRFVLAVDYASGKNALGAGGLGLYWYLSKDVSLLVGPVWFNEEAINGEWKLSTQLDINQTVFGN